METFDKNEYKKSVLMFCPKFFGYENRLSKAISEAGFDVDLYDERPSNSFFGKTFLRLNFKFYKPVVRRYIRNIICENKDKNYDYVFVVKSEAAGKKELKLLREAYPNAKFILYLWDSVENVPDGEKKLSLYDKVFTFDPVDAEKYSIKLRPLFFSNEYENNNQLEDTQDYLYDFAFIGTAHTNRALIVKKLADDCKKRGTNYFSYLFLPHKFVYLYNKLVNKDFKDVAFSDIKFQSITPAQITEVYKKSRSILDVEHIKQRGLTMRTIEMIGMGKKIITTNSYIKSYDFYNPNNIYLINRNSPTVDESFWTSKYEQVPKEIFDRYKIESFVRELFDEEN